MMKRLKKYIRKRRNKLRKLIVVIMLNILILKLKWKKLLSLWVKI